MLQSKWRSSLLWCALPVFWVVSNQLEGSTRFLVYSVCSAVILVSLFEMVRKFPSEYFSALLTGQALCGVISAVAQIITITLTEHPVQGGYIFFSIGKSSSISLINLEPKTYIYQVPSWCWSLSWFIGFQNVTPNTLFITWATRQELRWLLSTGNSSPGYGKK